MNIPPTANAWQAPHVHPAQAWPVPPQRNPRPYPWRQPAWETEPGLRFSVGRRLVSEPGYARLWRSTRDIDQLERAGFFNDGLTPAERRRWGVDAQGPVDAEPLSSPLPDPQQLAHLPPDRPWVVLLATGAFAPVHGGHLAMLDAAEAEARRRGWPVAMTYLSPSHDGYVAHKDGGRGAAFPAELRLALCREALAAAPSAVPRFADAWESLVAPGPLNFTAVARRLEHYLTHHCSHPVHVVCVFGADNRDFALAFETDDRTLCVGRPGHALPDRGATAPLESPFSSTEVRRRAAAVAASSSEPSGIYVLRDEGLWALEPWRHRGTSDAVLLEHWDTFARRVHEALARAFDHTPGPRPARFQRLPLAPQRALVARWAQETPVVNLDPCTSDLPGVIPWEMSRRFRVADGQRVSHGWGVRPGAAPLTAPLPAQVLLVDDDASTGQTLAHARAQLEAGGTQVIGTRLIIPASLPPGAHVFDVVDLRDFLPGTTEGGLVLEKPTGHLVRWPYLEPEISLAARAHVPVGKAWETSAAIRHAVAQFIQALGPAPQSESIEPSLKGLPLCRRV